MLLQFPYKIDVIKLVLSNQKSIPVFIKNTKGNRHSSQKFFLKK